VNSKLNENFGVRKL